MEGIHFWSVARVKSLLQGSCITACSFFTIGSKGLGIFVCGLFLHISLFRAHLNLLFLKLCYSRICMSLQLGTDFFKNPLELYPYLQCVIHWTRMRNGWVIKYTFTFVLGLSSNGSSKACFLFSAFLLFFLLLNILFYLNFIFPFMESSYHKILLVLVQMRLDIQINCLIHGFLKIYGFSEHGITWSFSWT